MNPWTAADIPPQTGRLAVVTGANSGIGYHTALELARKGARVVLACRNPAKAADALKRLQVSVPDGFELRRRENGRADPAHRLRHVPCSLTRKSRAPCPSSTPPPCPTPRPAAITAPTASAR